MSRFLFDHLDELGRRIDAARSLALFLDFDGTLVPLNDSPDQVQLPPSLRRRLLALSNQENRIVAVVSGRQRSDLQARVNVPGLVYAGNHGLEISGPGFLFIEPSAIDYRDKMVEFAKGLETRVKGIPGAWVEDKGLTLSVHSRLVGPEQSDDLRRIVHAALEYTSHPFVLSLGDHVYEIRPRVDWDKGTAVRWIRERMGVPDALSIYIGDDRTDEDAFAAIAEGITIKVGEPTETTAGYYVRSPAEVERFLEWLTIREHVEQTV
ncbi:MAG TPA: trehalose-phosphatase [Gemmataceae bacterium]|jgi:trehalose 6-phosphate phosphatase|nr:trehalose-phosphatase [Gemmataceae bacterium]